MTAPAYTFQDSDVVDIRRFCGYPAYGTGAIIYPYPWWFSEYQAFEARVLQLTATEANVVLTYLKTLRTLEAAIPAAGANLDTDEAAVWKHNKDEVRDRAVLFDSWRRRLCGFLGMPPGPDLRSSGSTMRLVV